MARRAPPLRAEETKPQTAEMTCAYLWKPDPCVFHKSYVDSVSCSTGLSPTHLAPDQPPRSLSPSLPLASIPLSAKVFLQGLLREAGCMAGWLTSEGLEEVLVGSGQVTRPWFQHSGVLRG